MYWITLLAISMIPGLFWVWFFYRMDKYEPEPKRLIIRTFFYGMAMVIPVGVVESIFYPSLQNAIHLRNYPSMLFYSIIGIGIIEEYFKYAAVRFTVYRSSEFNEVMDGIVYTVTAGLGFAALENLLYASKFGIQVGLFRAVVTSIAHASFSGIVGYYLGKAKFAASHEEERNFIIKGLGIAAVLHGVYDFLFLGKIIPPGIEFLVVTVLVITLYRYLKSKVTKAINLSPFRDGQE